MSELKTCWFFAIYAALAVAMPLRGEENRASQPRGVSHGDIAFVSNWDSIGSDEPLYETARSCAPRWQHRTGAFADLLLLSPRDVSVPYAESLVTVSTAPAPGVFVSGGRVGEVEPGYKAGARGGFMHALDDESSLAATYSWFRSSGDDLLTSPQSLPVGVVPGPAVGDIVLAPLAIQSEIPFAPFNILDERSGRATASQSIRFDLVDLDYRWLWASSSRAAVNGIIGVRYGHLEQAFQSRLTGNLAFYDVNSSVDIDGIGIRFGCNAEQAIGQCGLSIYSQAIGSLLAGEFNGRYQFLRTPHAGPPPAALDARVELNDHRVIPMIDLELGIAWTCSNERVRIKAGYTFSSWFNAAGVKDMIQAAQTHAYGDIESTITFDGLVAGIEYLH